MTHIIKTISNSGRIRTTPQMVTTDNVFGTTIANKTLTSNKMVGDFYCVELFVHKDIVKTEVVAPPPPHEMNVPYRSQWDTDANNRSSDCGQTCVAMLAEWRGVRVAVNDLRVQSATNGLSTGEDLVANFKKIGMSAIVQYIVAGDVVNLEPEKLPCICLVRYGEFKRSNVQDDAFMGWHWLVLLQQNTDGSVLTHDPNFWGTRRSEGDRKVYTKDEWDRAFVGQSSPHRRIIVRLI
jgi:hypothetical protein